MSSRGAVAGIVKALVLPCGVLVALVGCFVLGGTGLALVGVASGLLAILAAGVRLVSPADAIRRALTTFGWAACTSLLLAGIAGLAGGAVAGVAAAVGAVTAAVVWLLRARRGRSSRSRHPDPLSAVVVPVTAVPTAELGREWLRTTDALAAGLDRSALSSVVQRRAEALDELERRDPHGFSRWLAEGCSGGRNPAEFVQAEDGSNRGSC